MDILSCDKNIFVSKLSKLALVVNARKYLGFHLNLLEAQEFFETGMTKNESNLQS